MTTVTPAPVASPSAKVLAFMQASGAALDKAAAQLDEHTAKQAAVNAAIPAAVDALLAHGRIQPNQKQAALEALQDHGQAIAVITKLAGHRNTQEVASLGQPGTDQTLTQGGAPTQKQASDSNLRESDRRLLAAMGLPVPN